MKMVKALFFFFLLMSSSLMVSCNVGAKPIEYGSDGCHFCSMTIVDRQHAAELVTKKGKVFKFDAVECMLNHSKEVDYATIGLMLVNDYDAPGSLIDATMASYLICLEIPSPMGEYLTAFGTKEGAEKVMIAQGGDPYSWQDLRARFGIQND